VPLEVGALFSGWSELARFHPLARSRGIGELSRAVRDARPDVVFHPFLHIEPLQLDAVNAVLVLDGPWSARAVESIRRADAIFTLAEGTRREIVEGLSVEPGKVHAIDPPSALLHDHHPRCSTALGDAEESATRAARKIRDVLRAAASPMLSPVDPLPLVSIVTPSFQQGTFIERTIESVLGQDYPHIEYLVVDGGSTDRTLEVLETYSHRIRWISRRDRGQSDAINQGLRAARGEILAYLNSDDTYRPGAVRKAVSYLVAHPTCDLVYGQGRYIDRDDNVIGSLPSPPFDAEGFARSCFISQPATFWRRRLHDRVGYFDEEEHLVMDYEFFLRAARTARIAMIDDTLAEARVWEGAKSVASRARQALAAIEAVHRHRGSVPIDWINGCVWATLEGRPLGGLPRPVRIALRRLLRRWIQARLLFRYDGLSALTKHWISVEPSELYADGWMGEALQRTVSKPLGATHLRITGELPIWPKRRPLVLDVQIGRRRLGRVSVAATGSFEAEFPIPAELASRFSLDVTLRALRTFIPADYENYSDERSLACHIHSIGAIRLESHEASDAIAREGRAPQPHVWVRTSGNGERGANGFRRWIRRRMATFFSPKLGLLFQYSPRPLPRLRHDTHPRQLAPLPRISIVTPSLNQAAYLERTIRSVLDQDYPALEYIVADGGSSDETVAILERYRSALQSCESAPDRGRASALNRAFARSSGEIMAWLNSDDLLLPRALHTVAAFLASHPEVDVVYGHRLIIDEHDLEVGRWVLPPHDDAALSWADFIPQESLFWRRRIWERVGGAVDESFQFALDWDLILRFRAVGAKFARIPRFLGAFRIYSQQKTEARMETDGHPEVARIRERCHGRVVSQDEIEAKLRPYLRRHLLYHKLSRLGFLPP
jgi:glycosyltransferase involved in cell wall biosynthesis